MWGWIWKLIYVFVSTKLFMPTFVWTWFIFYFFRIVDIFWNRFLNGNGIETNCVWLNILYFIYIYIYTYMMWSDLVHVNNISALNYNWMICFSWLVWCGLLLSSFLKYVGFRECVVHHLNIKCLYRAKCLMDCLSVYRLNIKCIYIVGLGK